MRRLLPIPLALVFAFCAYAIQSVQLPGRVLACSCFQLSTFAEAAANPASILVVARVGQTLGRHFEAPTPLEIERTFTGEIPGQVLVQGIGDQGAACQLSARAGERWLFDVYRSPDGRFGVSSCGFSAKLGTDHGDALLAEAIGLFGDGQPPASPPPEPAAPVDVAPWLSGVGFAALLALVAAGMFGVVVLVARRRPG